MQLQAGYQPKLLNIDLLKNKYKILEKLSGGTDQNIFLKKKTK